MGLPPAHRLRPGDLAAARDGGAVAARGRGASGPLRIQVSVVPDRPPGTRVGFAVGRAVGPAVVRNAVRRRLREGLRPLLAPGTAGTGPVGAPAVDAGAPPPPRGATLVLVRVAPEAAGMASAELHRHLGRAWHRALGAAGGPGRGPGPAGGGR